MEAMVVEKFAAVSPVLDERGRRLWAAAESRSIGYGGDALVCSATGLARETIRKGRREIGRGVEASARVRRPGAGRPGIDATQPGIRQALERLVDPLTRGGPGSPLRWTCKSRAKLAAALTKQGWKVSSTTVGRLLNELGCRLQSVRKTREGLSHPERNAQFEHINESAERFLGAGEPVPAAPTATARVASSMSCSASPTRQACESGSATSHRAPASGTRSSIGFSVTSRRTGAANRCAPSRPSSSSSATPVRRQGCA